MVADRGYELDLQSQLIIQVASLERAPVKGIQGHIRHVLGYIGSISGFEVM